MNNNEMCSYRVSQSTLLSFEKNLKACLAKNSLQSGYSVLQTLNIMETNARC